MHLNFSKSTHSKIMALKVIGAGWGRTGTESLKKALEILEGKPCYHMFELVKDGRRLRFWEALERSGKTDFDALFEGYSSAVDFPAAYYYKQLMAKYPDAKIILTVRDPDKWFESASKTIFRKPPAFVFLVLRFLGMFSERLGTFPKVFDYASRAFLQSDLFQNRLTDKAFLAQQMADWNAEVIRSVPAERLLIYQVSEGWGPLCRFLGKPVPEVSFPRANDSDAFQKRLELKNLIKAPAADA